MAISLDRYKRQWYSNVTGLKNGTTRKLELDTLQDSHTHTHTKYLTHAHSHKHNHTHTHTFHSAKERLPSLPEFRKTNLVNTGWYEK